MNLLILSDLNWHAHLRSMSKSEIENFDATRLTLDRYQRIRRYLQIIEEEKAEVVLFAGDVTGDGFCGHGFQYAFLLLLTLLEQRKIQSYFISGNHDPSANYQVVVDQVKNFQFTQEISDQLVQFNGINILGINYNQSKSKRTLKAFIKKHQEGADIVVAHSQLKRRIRLFDIPCSYLVTGHYDRKLCTHRDTVYVALDNDSEAVSYAVLALEGEQSKVHLKIKESEQVVYRFTEEVSQLLAGNRNSELILNEQRTLNLDRIENAPISQLRNDQQDYLYFKYLRGTNYTKSLETLYKVKQDIPLEDNDLSLAEVLDLPIIDTYNISASMMEDYLGKKKMV